ncbi:MAG: GNAT family N-acetyltransferase [Christensenellaceae bacterium]|jgi:ribosomal protein S18 acetylase RimI-like enzyme|nr:GNAT family N-acetyltransferase [Christensenellaceae bacterium]
MKEKTQDKKSNRYSIFRDCIKNLKTDWVENIKPFIEFDKQQTRKYDKYAAPYPIVGEPNPKLYLGCFKSPYEGCDDNPYEMDGMLFNKEKARYIEQRKIADILKSFFFQYIQKIAVEIMRCMLIVCTDLGYKQKDFGLKEFFTFSSELIGKDSRVVIETFPKYKAFNLLFKLNNFLKHNTKQAYDTLKDNFPDNIHKGNKTEYENGMYAGDFIYLQDGYLDKIFDKLLIFFGEYCKVILGEDLCPQLFYRELLPSEYKRWEELAKSEFLKEDFCNARYLLNPKQDIKGWVLLDDDEWIGCCFIDYAKHWFNKDGVHFLEACTFPKYRGKGYAKYLARIMFDKSKGFAKSMCINPSNSASISAFAKYGFTKAKPYKTWDIYLCDKDYYPKELENLKITTS